MFMHRRFMSAALTLARRALGSTSANPAVGCVVVRGDKIVASGVTGPSGVPHAETAALSALDKGLEGLTMYVTLEPCVHYAKTPPCVDSIIRSRAISRVIVAVLDPDERVCGNGVRRLRDNGLEVIVGVMCEDAIELNIGFFYRKLLKRPFVAAKVAVSMDSKIALSSGESKWITGESSRRLVHMMRIRYDAIIIGINTLLCDDPMLNCRIRGIPEFFSPVRIVVDRKCKMPKRCAIAKTAGLYKTFAVVGHVPTSIVLGVNYVILPVHENDFLRDLMKVLANIGFNRVLVEGGSVLLTQLLRLGLLDSVIMFRTGKVLGNDAKPMFGDMGLFSLDSCFVFDSYRLSHYSDVFVEYRSNFDPGIFSRFCTLLV